MKSLCNYIEVHHEEYGVALFVIPMLLVGYAPFFIGWCVALWTSSQ
ncbi:MAG: hypothetical protein JWQ76_4592 [Ramlibacter sp.]|nr:hypothetical protein [Ramlibacter sp.]